MAGTVISRGHEDLAGAERALDEAIAKNRLVELDLELTSGGSPLKNVEVEVEQTSHALLFGTGASHGTYQLASGSVPDSEREREQSRVARFLELFNQATLHFYWHFFEPERGKPRTESLQRVAAWYRDQGIALKGHPLCWHTLTAPWLLDLDTEGILREQLARVGRDVSDFKGMIDMWDVVNEAVIMPDFDKYDNGITRLCRAMGRVDLVKAMFDRAREANPEATLLLNDFNTSPDYAALVSECLGAGVGIDVIGIQSHMHQGWWGLEKTARVLDRFKAFGLPLHFTEVTLVSGELMPPEIEDLNDHKVASWPSTPEGEERQAREAVLLYKSLVAERAVEAITWWDLCDGAWLGAPSGLLRKDGSPKPVFGALKSLIKGEWWFKATRMRTDDRGRVKVRGFEGAYRVSVRGSSAAFKIEKGRGVETIRF